MNELEYRVVTLEKRLEMVTELLAKMVNENHRLIGVLTTQAEIMESIRDQLQELTGY